MTRIRYSADSHRIAWRHPDKSGDAGWYYAAYDDQWRMTCVYKRNPSDEGVQLAERFFYDHAGLAGGGGSSYIDSVIARDDQPVDDGYGSTPPTFILSRTLVYLQNWRGDVVGLVHLGTGRLAESVRYSAYGRPFAISASDFNASGMVGTQDLFDFLAAWTPQNSAGATGPALSGDHNKSGAVSVQDQFDFLSDWFAEGAGQGGGRAESAPTAGVNDVAPPCRGH